MIHRAAAFVSTPNPLTLAPGKIMAALGLLLGIGRLIPHLRAAVAFKLTGTSIAAGAASMYEYRFHLAHRLPKTATPQPS